MVRLPGRMGIYLQDTVFDSDGAVKQKNGARR